MALNNSFYYARLSGIHPTLPLAEILAVAEIGCRTFNVVGSFDLILIFESDPICLKRLADRLAYTKSIGILLGVYDSQKVNVVLKDIAMSIKELGLSRVGIELEMIRGVLKKEVKGDEIISRLKEFLKNEGITIDMKSDKKLEIFFTEGVIIGGLRLFSVNLKEYEMRRPRKRPFFKPGPLDPRLSRVFVNLSRLKEGDVFLDPFCGTGGIALEACLIKASKVLCGDLDRKMARGSLINLRHYGCDGRILCYLGDATKNPLNSSISVVGSVATDPPYGRSTSTKGRELKILYKNFLEDIVTSLVKGAYVVFAAPTSLRPIEIVEDAGLDIVERHYMYVHRSLVRGILVTRLR